MRRAIDAAPLRRYLHQARSRYSIHAKLKGHRRHIRQTHNTLITSFTIAGVVAALSFGGLTSPMRAQLAGGSFLDGFFSAVREIAGFVEETVRPAAPSTTSAPAVETTVPSEEYPPYDPTKSGWKQVEAPCMDPQTVRDDGAPDDGTEFVSADAAPTAEELASMTNEEFFQHVTELFRERNALQPGLLDPRADLERAGRRRGELDNLIDRAAVIWGERTNMKPEMVTTALGRASTVQQTLRGELSSIAGTRLDMESYTAIPDRRYFFSIWGTVGHVHSIVGEDRLSGPAGSPRLRRYLSRVVSEGLIARAGMLARHNAAEINVQRTLGYQDMRPETLRDVLARLRETLAMLRQVRETAEEARQEDLERAINMIHEEIAVAGRVAG